MPKIPKTKTPSRTRGTATKLVAPIRTPRLRVDHDMPLLIVPPRDLVPRPALITKERDRCFAALFQLANPAYRHAFLRTMISSLTDPGTKVLSPFKLSHVVLHTTNFPAMRDFYKIFLGGHATFENDQVSFQTYDDEDHRIGIIAAPPSANHAKAGVGLHHVSFTYRDLNELATAYLQRKNNGILPTWCVNHGPTTSIMYSDPDGNMLETQVENFDSVEESLAFLETEEFKRNPIGVEFQPEDLVRRLQRGESEESIKRRPVDGKRANPPF